MRIVALALLLLAGFAFTPAPALAQHASRPAPNLGFAYPAGGQQGTTFTVSVGGQNLAGASEAFFSAPGVTAKVIGYDRPLTQREINALREKAQQLQEKRAAARTDPAKPRFTAEDEKAAAEIKHTLATRGNRQATPAIAETVTLEVTLSAATPPGEHEFRLRANAGVSNPLVFRVGPLAEKTPPVVTSTAPRATPRGRVSESRTHPREALELTLPLVVNGQILPGEVDRFRFQARRGQRLTFAVAARALVPYLADAVPGWFQATLALYDAHGRELGYADDFRFDPDPVLACEIPADGLYTLEIKDALHRGREDFVYRLTAGELPYVTSIFPLGGAIDRRTAFDLNGWNLPRPTIEIDATDKAPGTYLLSVREPGVQSNSIRFALAESPPVLEAATPDDATQRLALPALVDGRIETAGDEDAFTFAGTRGAVVVAEVQARRLGSPLDSVLTLTDASGRRLAANDDFEDKGAGLLTHHSDSRLEFTLPEDGDYTVRVADAQRRGGPDYGYRLRLGAPQPDFELRVVPSTLNVRAGATLPITVHALRRDGFDGEIALSLQQAPPGVALSGARIPAGQDSVRLTLTAASNLREGTRTLALAGRAAIDGRAIMRRALPADERMQAFAYQHLVPAKELRLAVHGRGSTLRLADRLEAPLRLGPTTRIRLATPALKQMRNLTFTLVDPPAGISVREVRARGAVTDVIIACDPAVVKPGLQGNLLLEAFGTRASARAKSPPAGRRTALGTVPAIPFAVIAFHATDS